MKKIIDTIIKFFKNIFGQEIKVSVENNKKYNINKNKKCNISINETSGNSDKK